MFARNLRAAGPCALAMMAVGSFAATAAQAATGPEWIAGAAKTPLAGESVVTGTTVVAPVLVTAARTIECTLGDSTGAIIGGNPGRDTGKITFFNCKVAGTSPACTVGDEVDGTTLTTKELVSLLVYPETGTASALDAFYPKAGTEVTSVAFGTQSSCKVLAGKRLAVSANGTPAHEAVGPVAANQKCGLLAQVGKETAGTFELTASGVVAALGALNTPKPAITSASLRTVGTTEAIHCELVEDGETATFATQISQKLLNPANEVYGWK